MLENIIASIIGTAIFALASYLVRKAYVLLHKRK